MRWVNNVQDNVQDPIFEELNRSLHNEYQVDKLSEGKLLFVFSLSEYKDSLFLWSNYSKHDGYNLGINPYDLEEVFFSETLKFRKNNVDQSDFIWLEHGKVIYNYNKQIDIIIEELYNLIALLLSLVRPLQWISDFSKSFFYRMLFYSAFFKNAGFDDECEYRIAATSNKNFSCYKDFQGDFKDANGCFAPYLCIPVQSKKMANLRPLKEITIGPKNNLFSVV